MKVRIFVTGLLGVFVSGAALAATIAPPEGARVIDFRDVFAPANFIGAEAVRDEYLAVGVGFTGPGNDGGAILDESGNFLVTGYSPPSFLAFASAGVLSNGGAAEFPITLHFRHPVKYIQFNVGSFFGNNVAIEAFDKDGVSLGDNSIDATSEMQTLVFDDRFISSVVINGGGTPTILDDLAFVPDHTLIDFDDIAGAPTGFAATTPLRDRYAAEGVRFLAPNNFDGGAVLDKLAGFAVSGFSSPNFLAFNSAATMSNGGTPRTPQYLWFSPPVDHVSFLAGGSVGSVVTIEATDWNGFPVDEDSDTMASAMKTLRVDGVGITTLVIETNGANLVIDDLEFRIEGTLIDFDDVPSAPNSFNATTALRDRYKPLGIQFRGAGKNGPAILDDGSNFGVNGYSAPNFLAFSASGMLSDGGIPQLPLTMFFDPPAKRIDLRVGDFLGHRITVEGFDGADSPTGNNYVDATAAFQTLTAAFEGTTRLVLTSTGTSGVIDDIAFSPTDPCAHDICLAGDALGRYCHACVTIVCASDADCCSDEWTPACALALPQMCEYSCPPLCGDANVDGEITAPDALLALRTAVGGGTCPHNRCDYNGNGEIQAGDALAILRESVGLMTDPQCQDPV